MHPAAGPAVGGLLLLVGLAGAAWAWWPVPTREGRALILASSAGAPSLDVQWSGPAFLRRGEVQGVSLQLAAPPAATPDASTEPVHLRLTLQHDGLAVSPDAPLELALRPGESVTARWTVAARQDASARWLIEWVTGLGSRPLWLHPEAWEVRSLLGLSSVSVRAASILLGAIGLLGVLRGMVRR